MVLVEAVPAVLWPGAVGLPSLLDVTLALVLGACLGVVSGLLARLLWRRAPTVVAWVPLAALLAPQLLRPLELSYSWDPILSGALLLLVWWLPRLGAGLAVLITIAAPLVVAAGLERGPSGPGLLWLHHAPGGPRPDILLITVDTLRADAGLELPRPERWRHHEQAVSAAPWTLPAMISLFAGQPVREHLGGLPAQQGGGYTGPVDGLSWLPEALWERGYECVAFVSNPYLTRTFGFERGFQRFVHADDFREPFLVRRGLERARHQLTGRVERLRRERDDRVVAAALRQLERPAVAPRFTWVHLLAPHEYPRDVEGEVPGWVPGTEDPAILRDGYSANVQATEARIARLVAAVDTRTTVVAFTADHGEQLGEDGVFGHGLSLGDRELRVPLALRGPGVEPGVVGEQVSVPSLGPLLLALVDGEPDPALPAVTEAPVGGLRNRNKGGTFAWRSAVDGAYSEDFSAVQRARTQDAQELVEPDEATRRALEALGYLD